MTEEHHLRKKIIDFLVDLPALQEPNGRRAVLLNSGLDEILQHVDCTGTPYEFVTRTVTELYEYGNLPGGQPALDAWLQGTENLVGPDKRAKIETFRERLRIHLEKLKALGIKDQIHANGDFVSAEKIQNAVYQFFKSIEDECKYVPIFHPPHKIALEDHYVPIDVTLERRYRHTVETTGSYAEGEAESPRMYAMKDSEGKRTDSPHNYLVKASKEQKENMRQEQVHWQEVKQKHKRIIVLANPGLGKTALLKMEAMKTAQKFLFDVENGKPSIILSGVEVPLFFRLSEFASTEEEITDAISRLLQRNYPDTASIILALVAEKLKNGTCLLLLDALDEVSQEQRNSLAEKLNRFARYYASCPIIITSRIVGYGGGILRDAKEVEIVPFSRKQTDQYIEIWFKNLESDRMNKIEEDKRNSVDAIKIPEAKGLIHELQQKPQIRSLAQNPLLLSLLCSLYQENELTLPARRVQVYEQVVHYMLYDWRRVSQRRVLEQALTDTAWIEAKLELLEQLAYQFFCEYKEVFSMRELLTKIEGCKCKTILKYHNAPDIIKELSQEDGIIQQLDGQGHNARYIFLHRTFQEYLAASYLKQQPNGIELAKAHFWDFSWHETLILFAGLLDKSEDKPKSEHFMKILLAEHDDIFHTLLLLAGRCLAECPQLEMPKLIDRLYKIWRHDHYNQFFESTIVDVSQTHKRMLTYLLTTALYDTTWRVGFQEQTALDFQAQIALGKIGGMQVVKALLKVLHDSSDKYIRERAISVLGKIGDVQAVKELLAVLHDTEEVVRRQAVSALGEIGDAQAVDDLLKTLEDPDSSVRKEAALALGKIGDVCAVDGLLKALDDPESYVKMEVALALGKIGDARAVDGLIAVLYSDDVNWDGKEQAAAMLGKLGGIRVADSLLAVLHAEVWGYYLADGIGKALKDIHDKRIVEILLTELQDKNEDIRAESAWALGEIGDTLAFDALLNTLNDSHLYVKGKAAEALGKIGDPRAINALLILLDSDDLYAREMAVEALGKIGDPRALDALLGVLKVSYRGILESIYDLLNQLETLFSNSISKRLLPSIKDDYMRIRLKTVEALGEIGDPRAVNDLLAALHDENDFVRQHTVRVLGKIGDPRAIKGLLSVLHDVGNFGDFTGIGVTEALGKIGTLNVLKKLLYRVDIDVYDTAIFPVVRRLAIKFSHQRPRPACLPVYPQPQILRWLRKGLWRGRIFLNRLRREMR